MARSTIDLDREQMMFADRVKSAVSFMRPIVFVVACIGLWSGVAPGLASGPPHGASAQGRPGLSPGSEAGTTMAAASVPLVIEALRARDRDGDIGRAYEGRGSALFTTPQGLSAQGQAVRDVLARADDFGLDAARYQLAVPLRFDDPAGQAAVEAEVARAVIAYARDARGARIADPSKLSAMFDMKPVLPAPGDVIEALARADDTGAALVAFHPQHAGFKALQRAYAAARAAKAGPERLQRLLVNLERWRWMPADLGALHVWNNVPEQVTRVIKGGDVVHLERIVVGKVGTATPILSGAMSSVVFHPSWGVPKGIKARELAPMLARASARRETTLMHSFGFEPSPPSASGSAAAALARRQLQVFYNGRPISPDAVDWRKANIHQFTFVQPPSRRNAMGVVKFRFPNKYDVFMHDTQEKHLFAKPVRAYSNGCMRVRDPLALAAVLLGQDKGWGDERIASLVAGGRQSDVTLTTPIPVHLTYFTASVDAAGDVVLHDDIYGWDARVASALEGKAVALAAARVSPPSTPRGRPVRASMKPTPPPAAWSPWAGLSSN